MFQKCHRSSVLASLVLVFGLAVLVGVPERAAAEQLGRQGVLVLSAENLFGFAHVEQEVDYGSVSFERDFNVFGLGLFEDKTYMWTPRFAIDGYVINGLSIGGSLGLMVFDDDDSFNDNDDDDDVLVFLIGPRVGYTHMFANWVGIWARGGFTYYVRSEDEDNSRADWEMSQFSIDLEAMFVFVLTEGFGIEVGPVAHIGLTGELGFDDFNERDYQEWGIGIMVGLLGWFGV